MGGVGAWFYLSYIPRGSSVTDVLIKVNPFGDLDILGNNSSQNNNTEQSENNNTDSTENIAPKEPTLKQLTANAVSGFTLIEKASSTKVRFSEKETGHIFDINISDSRRNRVSNTTIPKANETIFVNNGSTIIYRYVTEGTNTISTYTANIPEKSEDDNSKTELSGSFLQDEAVELIPSPDDTQILTLLRFGGSLGTISQVDGAKKTQVWSAPLSEWTPAWNNLKQITMTTKPSSSVPGYSYSVDLISKKISRIVGNINGLTISPSPDGKRYLVSNNTLELSLLRKGEGSSIGLGVKTLPEKCAWSKDGVNIYCAIPRTIYASSIGYPDIWYMGLVSFSDDIWHINTDTWTTNLVYEMKGKSREDIDAINIKLNKSENSIFFVNKTDSSLWELNLNNLSFNADH